MVPHDERGPNAYLQTCTHQEPTKGEHIMTNPLSRTDVLLGVALVIAVTVGLIFGAP